MDTNLLSLWAVADKHQQFYIHVFDSSSSLTSLRASSCVWHLLDLDFGDMAV